MLFFFFIIKKKRLANVFLYARMAPKTKHMTTRPPAIHSRVCSSFPIKEDKRYMAKRRVARWLATASLAPEMLGAYKPKEKKQKKGRT